MCMHGATTKRVLLLSSVCFVSVQGPGRSCCADDACCLTHTPALAALCSCPVCPLCVHAWLSSSISMVRHLMRMVSLSHITTNNQQCRSHHHELGGSSKCMRSIHSVISSAGGMTQGMLECVGRLPALSRRTLCGSPCLCAPPTLTKADLWRLLLQHCPVNKPQKMCHHLPGSSYGIHSSYMCEPMLVKGSSSTQRGRGFVPGVGLFCPTV
jgi:hypothetical protein